MTPFRPIRGKYCWQPRQGDGALLLLHFGTPRLEVERYEGLLGPARDVRVRGEWELCVTGDGRLLVESDETPFELSEAIPGEVLEELEGQALLRAEHHRNRWHLHFDLGAQLIVDGDFDLGQPGGDIEHHHR